MGILKSCGIPDPEHKLHQSAILKYFDALPNGKGFFLIHEHNPEALCNQLKAQGGNAFEWKNIAQGPNFWKVEITKRASEIPAVTLPQNMQPAETVFVLDVTEFDQTLKHPIIYNHLHMLQQGDVLQLLNNHDATPLYNQLVAAYGPALICKYMRNEAHWYQVQIEKPKPGLTVGAIAALDVRNAEVLKTFGIDFWCGGKKTLKQACAAMQIDASLVEAALKNSNDERTTDAAFDFDRWSPDFLVDYIYDQHHMSFYEEGPVIANLFQKVAAKYGTHFKQLPQVQALYTCLQQKLQTQFAIEEQVLFPYIRALVKEKKQNKSAVLSIYSHLHELVHQMEANYEAAVAWLVQMRTATNNFEPPVEGCGRFQQLYKKLHYLETDLHQQIHLVNNIVFPKAWALEKDLRCATF